MPLALTGFILGALWGAWRARNRRGKTADMVQWALVHGLILAMLGLLAAILIVRMAG